MAQRVDDFRLRNFEIGGDFTLTNQHGERASLSELKGRIVFLLFGFTHCPDVCPTTVADLTSVRRELGDDARNVQIVFVSVDPERDTPPVLKKYLANFDPTILGLTGTIEEITRVSDRYSSKFRREVPLPGSEYSVAHTSFVYLLNREGKVRFVFPYDIGRDLLTEAARTMIQDSNL